MCEEIGDFENAIEMHHYFDDSDISKSMKLWDKIIELQKNNKKTQSPLRIQPNQTISLEEFDLLKSNYARIRSYFRI